MGLVVICGTLTVGQVAQALSAEGEPDGDAGEALDSTFSRFADDLAWWPEATKVQRKRGPLPY